MVDGYFLKHSGTIFFYWTQQEEFRKAGKQAYANEYPLRMKDALPNSARGRAPYGPHDAKTNSRKSRNSEFAA